MRAAWILAGWILLAGLYWALLYAHGEREATYVPVEAQR